MRRILLVLALLLPALALAAPGRAGGWAATYLDPVPAAFEAGATYTVGFWTLQHGTHPFVGELGKVGLRFSGGGRSVEFTAVELKEKGHYAAALALPEGEWRVEALQGLFDPFPVGTLKVPGALTVDPLDPRLKAMIPGYLSMNGGKDPWGEVRPPGFPRNGATPKPAAGPAIPEPAAATVGAPAVWPYWLGAGVLTAAALAALVVRRRVRA
ncbi:hypothetical protein [Nonomuraea africana]|uniref:Uncharacterized protein n=1 Tax=Nonomuraea africana TaxID=46171 RepID=A0ABR9K962_9ACTN|nr:hypothetical protein [Nonomuraea africana]MBE1558341.1 hypothetical protein [Nonomuraea africana]